MNFMVMFYRKDILSDLKLSIPETWDDVCTKALPVLLKNNMEVYLPLSSGYSLYQTLLYQKGGSIYNENLTESMLNSSVINTSLFLMTPFLICVILSGFTDLQQTQVSSTVFAAEKCRSE